MNNNLLGIAATRNASTSTIASDVFARAALAVRRFIGCLILQRERKLAGLMRQKVAA